MTAWKPSAFALKASSSAADPEAVASLTCANWTGTPRVHRHRAFLVIRKRTKVYRIQWTPSLEQPQWTNLEPLISGTGTEVSVFDSAREHPRGILPSAD